MQSDGNRFAIRESEWMTVYREKNGDLLFESKFLVQGLTIKPETLRSRWQNFSQEEKHEFVQAFQAKANLSSGDQEVIGFLIDNGDPDIWINMASLVARYHDKERASKFFIERIKNSGKPKANFYQAIASLGDRRAIPVLRESYAKYARDSELECLSEDDYFDYFQCSAALVLLDGSNEYSQTLEHFSSSAPNENIRKFARIIRSQTDQK